MQSGKLRQRLQIQNVVVNRDADGGQHIGEDDWITIATVSASLTPLQVAATAEEMIAAQVTGRVMHRIVMRYRPGITTTQRLVMRPGRVFEIVSVISTEERKKELVITAVEKT